MIMTGLFFSIPATAQLVPFQLEERNVKSNPSGKMLEKAIEAIIDMLQSNSPSAQVVENQIVVNVSKYYATISRENNGWKLKLQSDDLKPVEATLAFGKNQKIDQALSQYL